MVNPDLKPSPIELVQTAPGRYEATIENAEASGNYFVNLGYRGPDNVQGMISSGRLGPVLRRVPRAADATPPRSRPSPRLTDGQVVTWKFPPDGRVDLPHTVAAVDHFRRDPGLINPRSFAALWPTLLWLAACLFLGDVAVRRIALDVDRIKRGRRSTSGGSSAARTVATASDYMEKLRSRKAEVDEQLDRSRGTRRDPARRSPRLFPTEPSAGSIGEPLLEAGELQDRPRPAGRTPAPGMAAGPRSPRSESYTNRLLKAKQRVWEEREKDKDNEKKP